MIAESLAMRSNVLIFVSSQISTTINYVICIGSEIILEIRDAIDVN